MDLNQWNVCICGQESIRSNKCAKCGIKNARSYSEDRYQNINKFTHWLNGGYYCVDDMENWVDYITRGYCLNEATANQPNPQLYIVYYYLLYCYVWVAILSYFVHSIEKRERIKLKLNNFIWLICVKLYGVFTVNFIKSSKSTRTLFHRLIFVHSVIKSLAQFQWILSYAYTRTRTNNIHQLWQPVHFQGFDHYAIIHTYTYATTITSTTLEANILLLYYNIHRTNHRI